MHPMGLVDKNTILVWLFLFLNREDEKSRIYDGLGFRHVRRCKSRSRFLVDVRAWMRCLGTGRLKHGQGSNYGVGLRWFEINS